MYKRQVRETGQIGARIDVASTHANQVVSTGNDLIYTLVRVDVPVSYTHLDVYKRQVYNLNVQMKESSELLEEVVVTAQKTKFASEKTGATTNISNTQIALSLIHISSLHTLNFSAKVGIFYIITLLLVQF